MLLNHDHFFTSQESIEATVEWLVGLVDSWRLTIPLDALGTREEFLHQGLLAADLHLDMAITNPRSTAVHAAMLVIVDSVDSLGITLKLDVAIHGLAGRTLHDDVDGVKGSSSRLADQTSIATNGGNNFVLCGAIWNLDEMTR